MAATPGRCQAAPPPLPRRHAAGARRRRTGAAAAGGFEGGARLPPQPALHGTSVLSRLPPSFPTRGATRLGTCAPPLVFPALP